MEKINLRKAKILGEIGIMLSFLSTAVSLSFQRFQWAPQNLPYNYGGYGSLVLNVSLSLTSIVSMVLLLLAFYEISKRTQEREIFSNYLTSLLIGLIGAVAIAVAAIVFANSLKHMSGIVIVTIGIFAIAVIIASMYFLSKSLKRTGEVLENDYFVKAGTFMLYGAYLLVILVGAILSLIAAVYVAIGFFTMREELEINRE